MNNTYTIFWPNSWTWEEIHHSILKRGILLGDYVTHWDYTLGIEYTVVTLPDSKQIVIDDEKMWSEQVC